MVDSVASSGVIDVRRIPLFLLEPTRSFRRHLRRVVRGSICPLTASEHAARVVLDESPIDGDSDTPTPNAQGPHENDPRWPSACKCGRLFEDGDAREVTAERVYVSTHGRVILSEAEPGSVFDATWAKSKPEFCGKDGKSIVIVLPDLTRWWVDAKSKAGNRWTRIGIPPRLTIWPAVRSGTVHVFVAEGVIVKADPEKPG